MKKLLLILTLAVYGIAYAQAPEDAPQAYSLSLKIGYAHNLTYGSFANFDLDAYMPIHRYFEMEANVRTSTVNAHTLGVQLRPKFLLPVGELYLEDRLMANLQLRDHFTTYTHALSLGYRMQYVDVQLGFCSRFMQSPASSDELEQTMVVEPLDMVYRIEARVRPATSPWNISLAMSNMDNYQIERMWQPMFYLAGWYDINDDWRVSLQGKVKPAGVFHLNTHYYGSEISAGVEYRF